MLMKSTEKVAFVCSCQPMKCGTVTSTSRLNRGIHSVYRNLLLLLWKECLMSRAVFSVHPVGCKNASCISRSLSES